MSKHCWRAEPDSNRLPPTVLWVCFRKHLSARIAGLSRLSTVRLRLHRASTAVQPVDTLPNTWFHSAGLMPFGCLRRGWGAAFPHGPEGTTRSRLPGSYSVVRSRTKERCD